MATTRRTPEQVHAIALKIHAAAESKEMSIEQALNKYELSDSTYRRWLKKGGPNQVTVQRGSVRADTLPPRPKKGGKRTPRPVDMNDVGSLAVRIARLDKKMAGLLDMREERKRLAERLMQLLKGTTGR